MTGARKLAATSAGEIAAALLGSAGEGTVIARFAHSLYVRLGERGCACVGEQTIGAGPLNVLLGGPDWACLHAVDCGRPVVAGGGLLSFSGGLQVALARAALWQPRLPAVRANAIGIGLRTLRARARDLAPADGLARLALPAVTRRHADPLLDLARPGWDALARWLARALEDPARAGEPQSAVGALLGLGPGLTPSGDDVIAGALIALRSLAQDAAAQALWSWIALRIEGRTSALSAAHLRAAAHGQGHEALHAVLEWLLEGAPEGSAQADRAHGTGVRADRECGDCADALGVALRALARLGHCSGWDALAGVMLVCRAYTARRATSRVASSAACAFEGATTTPARSSVRHWAE